MALYGLKAAQLQMMQMWRMKPKYPKRYLSLLLSGELEGASLLKGARNVYYLPQVEKQLTVTCLRFQPGMLQVGMHEG